MLALSFEVSPVEISSMTKLQCIMNKMASISTPPLLCLKEAGLKPETGSSLPRVQGEPWPLCLYQL